jgi:phospholipase/carboxylesterase
VIGMAGSMSRRSFLAMSGAIAFHQSRGDGHLSAKITAPSRTTEPGEYPLGLSADRDGLLVVPKSYRPAVAAPLAIMLHGASGHARRVAALFSVARELGIVVLAPESRGVTWDAIRGRFGPDIDFLNDALARTFDRCAIDKRRIAIGGFSDGATYALSVGLASGDFVTHVLACSPGFIVPGPTRGLPRIYMSHGTADEILPINRTSRQIQPVLRSSGYVVKYHEFDGPHAVPPEIAREAFEWFLGP